MGALGPTAGRGSHGLLWTVFVFCTVLVFVLALAIGMPDLWPLGLIAVFVVAWVVLDRRGRGR